MQDLALGVWYAFTDGIAICSMLYGDFIKIPEWIAQRNTENRAKKEGVLDRLQELFPTHYIVVIGELTEDDEWEDGKKYKKGSRWVLDANTRRYLWVKGETDRIPEKVLAVRFTAPTLLGLRNLYWSYDNPSASEKTGELITGLFKSLGVVPKTKIFSNGSIPTALSYCAKFDNPKLFGAQGIWSKPKDGSPIDQYKKSQTLLAVYTYKDAIIAVDELLSKTGVHPKATDQTFLAALMLHYIKFGHFSDKIVNLVTTITGNKKDSRGKKEVPSTPPNGAVTPTQWIHRENNLIPSKEFQPVIKERGKGEGYMIGIPFMCYWLCMAEEKGLDYESDRGPRSTNGGNAPYQGWFEKYLTRSSANALKQHVESLEVAFTKK